MMTSELIVVDRRCAEMKKFKDMLRKRYIFVWFKEKLNRIDIQRFAVWLDPHSLHLIPIRARQAITSTVSVGVSACIIGGVVTRGYTETMSSTLSLTKVSPVNMQGGLGKAPVRLVV